MGTTLRQIVEDIGGGVAAGRTFKAVQIGGPSGGCVPARLADTPVDYESLRDQLKVVYLPNFNVTNGQRIYPAAELSEHPVRRARCPPPLETLLRPVGARRRE